MDGGESEGGEKEEWQLPADRCADVSEKFDECLAHFVLLLQSWGCKFPHFS